MVDLKELATKKMKVEKKKQRKEEKKEESKVSYCVLSFQSLLV